VRPVLLVACLLGLVPIAAWAGPADPAAPAATRSSEEGRPFIRTYQPLELGGGSQTWTMLQDRRGVMYFATNAAILEFDGATWRRITAPELATGSVRALVEDETGRIWVSSTGTVGYLAPDATGTLKYVSIIKQFPSGFETDGEFWRAFVTKDGIVFQTEKGIFRLSHDHVTGIRPASIFNRAQMADGQVYVGTPEGGLNLVEGDTLKPLPGTMSLGNEAFPVVLRYDEKRLLIGTRRDGLFLYDGAALTRFPTEFDAVIAGTQLYRGLVMPGPTFALSTTNAGLLVIDKAGHRVQRMDRSNGLPSDTVYSMLRDREGALWLGLDNGVARVETPSPYSYFNQSDGLGSGVQAGQRFDGRLYLGLQSGGSVLVPASADGRVRAHFEQIFGTGSQCWSYTKMVAAQGSRSAIVLGCGDGLYEIQGDRATVIKQTKDLSFRPDFVLQSRVDPTRLWVGLFSGRGGALESFRWIDGKWTDEGMVPTPDITIRTIFENADGSLWAGTQTDGVLRVTFATRPAQGAPRPDTTVKHFTTADGLTSGGVTVLDMLGTPVFNSGVEDPAILLFDEKTQRFVRQTALDHAVDKNLAVGGFLVGDADGHLFLNLGRDTAILSRHADGTWAIDNTTFSRLGTTPTAGYFPDEGHMAWLQLSDGRLVRFDTSQKVTPPAAIPVLVRRITGMRDRVLFAGDAPLPSDVKLLANENGLRFQYSLPSYIDESVTEYQSRLDGFDADWSDWTHDPQREYTNLAFGSYQFRVRARGVSGVVSDESAYAFTILAPWYRTWWAYVGYVLLAVLGLAGLTWLTRQRVEARERQRSQFAEAKLRAEAAESLAKTESEGKKNVELLSEMGREITASLDFETIFGKLYDRVNELADADVFGVGLYHRERNEIEYRLAIEDGKRYAPYTRDTTNRDQLPVWCIEHREPVFINDITAEATRYISSYQETSQRLEDGSMSQPPQSIIYLPLVSKDRVLGIITIQSLRKHAYADHHLNVMQSLASYTAIALDNADAYRQLNEHEHEIRRLFEEAEKARSIAEEADAAKSAFLSTVSHELRTPLTSVLGFAKIIRKRLEDRIFPLVDKTDTKVGQAVKQVEDNLKVVVSEGERLTKLIDDVLDLAKIEAGKLEWHMESVDVADIIDRATAATSSLFDQKGLHLEKQVASDLPSVTGDRDRLIQVVINLISNAVKFTNAGSVTCKVERRAGELVVSVIDTGLGISPADQPKVFERFKQVGDTLTDKPKGTGLGLPICKEIVEHHAGRIWVESALGAGSTFSFSLPVTVEQGALPLTDRSGPVELAALIRQLRDQVIVTTPRTTERQPRILVVDDEANIRELLHQEFTEAGYAVTMASNGREAIAAVRRERPDLVVLDVMMPEMNGFDVAAVLKNDPATLDIPIVVLSIVQDRERGFRLGVDRYLTKPIDTDLLFKEVGLLIEQKKSHKRVMVVDEDASTVRTLTDVLTTRGYSVIEARSDDLLERAVASQPDIILLNSVSSARSSAVQMLRFEKGMENVLFLVYQ
jgi:signal transduction histidine kinase/CheY-like chemotaxis protein/ligand-binding sensor domain-containing protein